MAQVSYPGVYVEEVSSGVRPITAASTSTAAFIGQAERGSLTDAVRITNFTQFQNLYGGYLQSSFLAHAVFQFFNNGGAICYIVRVAGDNVATASINLADRAGAPAVSLTVAARSPGGWGNALELVVSNGTRDPGNEFNLTVYMAETAEPVERFENLSMVSSAPNFVETVTANATYVRVTVNVANANAVGGSSRGAGAPTLPLPVGRTRLRINIDNDGYQEVDLQVAVDDAVVADLATAANVATALQARVRALTRLRASTNQDTFDDFTAVVAGGGELLLTAGVASVASSVTIAPAANDAQSAVGLLRLGQLAGGTEIIGGAITRPLANTAVPRYFVGDHALPAAGVVAVVAGSDGDPVTTDLPYIAGFARLDDKDDVSLICVPGIGSSTVVGEGMNYCANRSLSDCFFIGDMGVDVDTVEEAQAFVGAISPKNSYGAVYMPWLLALDPSGVSKEPIALPPSGYIAGQYARTDNLRGVWKAAAGTSAGIAGSTGLVVRLTDVEQGLLNPTPYHVNVLREFAAAGRVIWGARTITSDAEWNYIPVRRTAIMLRVSIYRGIQWAVFEPNDTQLWAQLRLNISSFMMTLYRRGAFQGNTPDKAFFVKVDGETTTQADIDAGIVNIQIGFAPLKPAEFIVVQISQKAGQSA